MEKTDQLKLLKEGFHKTFWVANGMELFERLAYYGQQIVFMIYMRNKLGFTESEAGQLSGIFGGLILRYVFNDDPQLTLIMAGVFMILGAISTFFVSDILDKKTKGV